MLHMNIKSPGDIIMFMARAITEAKKAKGLDQEDLARIANISRRTVAKIETGDMSVSAGSYAMLLFALDATYVLNTDDQGVQWS